MVMLEAMACGTPVITTPSGAAPEIVDDGVTGYVCATSRAMRSAIEAVDQIERTRCRDAVLRRFSLDRMVGGYLDVYGAAIEDHLRRPSPAGSTLVADRVASMAIDPIAGD
jgi:glycosyltransferase involved in cell wall biosynthesis